MDALTEDLIKPQVLRWARERARVPLEKLAHKLQKKPEQIDAWEKGLAAPTLNQAQRLADVLHVPLGYLFLPSPPEERIPLPDFRTIAGAQPDRPSADFIDLLDDVVVKQQWYREFLLSEGRRPLDFVGRFTAASAVIDVADDVREKLRVNSAMRDRCRNWEEFLRTLIQNAEAIGILVMRSGVVEGNTHRPLSVDEFRGFAISDRIAPLVFLNGRDAQTAQIFTLAHELVHLWIGASGISNENLRQPTGGANNATERFCNATAAEILVPAAEFDSVWEGNSVDDNIRRIGTQYRVSTVVALRRAYDLSKIGWDQFVSYYKREDQKFKVKDAVKKQGGSYFNNVIARNSAVLTTTVVKGALEGKILYRDAAQLLNVSVPSIHKIADRLEKRARPA